MVKMLHVLSLNLGIFIIFTGLVDAVPTSPHIFVGNVKIGGFQAAGDVAIQARINNVNYAQSIQNGVRTRNTVTASDGSFGSIDNFQVCGDTTDTSKKEGGSAGDVVEFYVNNVKAITTDPKDGTPIELVVFASGIVTNIDLSVPSAGQTVTETPNGSACTIGDEIISPTPTPVPAFALWAMFVTVAAFGLTLVHRLRMKSARK
jgi:hypothetical protein